MKRIVGRSRGPQLPKECRTCGHYNPQSEAYACEFCPVNGGARVCHTSACPHWRTGNECMYAGLCTANNVLSDTDRK